MKCQHHGARLERVSCGCMDLRCYECGEWKRKQCAGHGGKWRTVEHARK